MAKDEYPEWRGKTILELILKTFASVGISR
jgi:hypothetical protein